MADARQRALAREAHADPEAEARWLRGRLREGRIDRDRLALAAAAGHRAARLALGTAPEREDPVLREWVWNFLPWGHRTILRGLLACAERSLLHADEAQQDLVQDLFDGLCAYCDDPTGWTFERLLTLHQEAWMVGGPVDEIVLAVHRVASAALEAINGSSDKRVLSMVNLALQSLQAELDEETIREIVRETLQEWALREAVA